MCKVTCRELRFILDKEWQRFYRMSYDEVLRYIRYNFVCSDYAARTVARELSRGY